MIPKEKILPTVLIVVDFLSAVGYIPTGNWRMIGYWIAAGCLTYFVTW